MWEKANKQNFEKLLKKQTWVYVNYNDCFDINDDNTNDNIYNSNNIIYSSTNKQA